MPKAPSPTYFPSPADFRAWLEAHHDSADELLVGFHKRGSGKPSLTWPESVDEALCFGWIDGVRKRVDEERYTIRFTPRREGSKWSQVNVTRVGVLEKEGRMRPAGRAAFEAGKAASYSYEDRKGAAFDEASERAFRADSAAWVDWERRPPWYRRTATFWVVGAKKEETRARRLAILIECSRAGKPLPGLDRTPKQ